MRYLGSLSTVRPHRYVSQQLCRAVRPAVWLTRTKP
jgi:hypothetical protein